jgi:hypothetical protein
MARCRACAAEFALTRVLDDWRCCCPSCDTPLVEAGSDRATILRKATIADRLEAQLVETLSQIASIPGNIELAISPIVIKLLNEIDWDRQLREDLAFAQREIDRVRAAVSDWVARLDVHSSSDQRALEDKGLTEHMHELANRLRKVGESIDSRRSETSTNQSARVRAAALSVDEAAEDVAEGNANESQLVDVLGDATDAISQTAAKTLL